MRTPRDRSATVRDELEAELVRRFGKGWRVYPQSSSAVTTGEWLGWNAMRDGFDDVVRVACSEPVSLALLVEGVASLLAPVDTASTPVADAALEFAQGMIAVGTTAPRSALDAVLAVVASGHPALAGAGSGREAIAVAAALWDVATRIAGAVLARQLAAGGARLSATIGPGVLGAMPVTVPTQDLEGNPIGSAVGRGRDRGATDGELSERYRAAAARYIQWQQYRVCLCRGRDAATHRGRHHLHQWRPGTRTGETQAKDLSLWFRTWVMGQQRAADGLPTAPWPKALEQGLLYRHFLPSQPEASIGILVGEALEERCTVVGCAGRDSRAHRIGPEEQASRSAIGTRRCPQDSSHDLDFNWKERSRHLVIVRLPTGPFSHQQFAHLAWPKGVKVWEFVDRGGVTRWLPLPHGSAFTRLRGRGAATRPGWQPTTPVTTMPHRSLDEEIPGEPAESHPPPHTPVVADVDIASLPPEVEAVLDELRGNHGPGAAAVLRRAVDLLLTAALIDIHPDCDCCGRAGRSGAAPWARPARTDISYCERRLEDLLSSWSEREDRS